MELNSIEKVVGLFGDVIIDKYKYYHALKLSPEGPAPIVRLSSESLSLGGAGNVAISIANLGLKIELNYAQSRKEQLRNIEFIENIAKRNNIKLNKIYSNVENSIPTKIRYYVDGKQFMREDLEEIDKIDSSLISDKDLKAYIKKFDVFVVSDYQKGLISKEVMKKIIFNCNQNNVPLFIDTKSVDINSIRDAFCLKINESEYNNLFKQYKLAFNEPIEDINKKIDLARKSVDIKNLILTLGSRGSVISNSSEIRHVESDTVDVVDITGAGDAFLAGITYSFLKRNNSNFFDLKKNLINKEDLEFANKAASSVVVSKGTVPISKNFLSFSKRKAQEKSIVGFTNGCFDILHLGHLSLFKKAKEKCDYLIVGLNSDSSIKNLKGDGRPINEQLTRIEILKSIVYIDEVRIFDEETPLRLIKEISPNILFKGADYNEEDIIGAEFVKSYGGRVVRVELISGKSTSQTIKKIKNITENS